MISETASSISLSEITAHWQMITFGSNRSGFKAPVSDTRKGSVGLSCAKKYTFVKSPFLTIDIVPNPGKSKQSVRDFHAVIVGRRCKDAAVALSSIRADSAEANHRARTILNFFNNSAQEAHSVSAACESARERPLPT
jgi:hypothetical protein